VLPDRELWLAPPEYVIVRKLQWFADSGSERHLRDIRTMLDVSLDVIDQDALRSWIERLDLRSAWALVGP
jgi:hypothetical protein